MSKLILASASPRRHQLLQALGVPFTAIPAAIDEGQAPDEDPLAYVKRMAHTKARQMAQHYPEAFVLGADTIVIVDTAILGKPRDAAHARQMLRRLSSRDHLVVTALALLQHTTERTQCDTACTRVYFRSLTPEDIDTYLATDEPFDKAGAYAIQGGGGAFVATIEGCYTNVVGLPVKRTAALLRAAGFAVPFC